MSVCYYNRFLSYVILCTISFWVLVQCDTDDFTSYWCFSNIGYGLICLNGFIGMSTLRYKRDHCKVGTHFKRPSLRSHLSYFTYIYSIPLIIMDVQLYYRFSFELAILHLIYPMVAMFPRLICGRENIQILDLIMLLNFLSLTIICALKQNYAGIAAGVSVAVGHFFISSARRTFGLRSRTLQNYLMAMFVMFSYIALELAEQDWLRCEDNGVDPCKGLSSMLESCVKEKSVCK